MTILVEGASYPAHRVVLAAHSEYFHRYTFFQCFQCFHSYSGGGGDLPPAHRVVYCRPILYTLYGAVNFLYVLKKYIMYL